MNSIGCVRSIRVMLPAYVVAFLGCVSDYITTRIGLGMGFYETHLQSSPLLSMGIFVGAITILAFTLPRSPKWKLCTIFLATWSFLGAANNILVIFGVFGGLVI